MLVLGLGGCSASPGKSARSAQNDSELAQVRAEMARLEERLADALAERDAAQRKTDKCEQVALSAHGEQAASLPVVKMAPPEGSTFDSSGAPAPESRLVVRVEGDGDGEIVESRTAPDPVLPPNSGVKLSEEADSSVPPRSSSPQDPRQKGATKKSRSTSE